MPVICFQVPCRYRASATVGTCNQQELIELVSMTHEQLCTQQTFEQKVLELWSLGLKRYVLLIEQLDSLCGRFGSNSWTPDTNNIPGASQGVERYVKYKWTVMCRWRRDGTPSVVQSVLSGYMAGSSLVVCVENQTPA